MQIYASFYLYHPTIGTFIHSFNKYLSNAYNVCVPASGDTAVKGKVPVSESLKFRGKHVEKH